MTEKTKKMIERAQKCETSFLGEFRVGDSSNIPPITRKILDSKLEKQKAEN